MGTYRIHLDANRSAVRATGAAPKFSLFGCPEGVLDLGLASRRTEGQELPLLEPPVE
ncbi:hypothetical protein [Nocardioides stalactiti]|uniref:hypothetical protein n=1 Tax=Nocardioides stalactiti TaxID=2755356 RepID=UPI0016034A6B|nr:hypothetical protein [Nocardioides stalactiti]